MEREDASTKVHSLYCANHYCYLITSILAWGAYFALDVYYLGAVVGV